MSDYSSMSLEELEREQERVGKLAHEAYASYLQSANESRLIANAIADLKPKPLHKRMCQAIADQFSEIPFRSQQTDTELGTVFVNQDLTIDYQCEEKDSARVLEEVHAINQVVQKFKRENNV